MKYLLTFFSALLFTCNAFSSTPVTYYLSAQFPINPHTGQLIDGDIETLTNQAITNLHTALSALGLNLHHVVQTTVYLTDIRDYAGMNAAYSKRFNSTPQPARDVVEVSNLIYPTRVQISCIAQK